MTSHLELSSRAALCRQFARREPNYKGYWLAEAENWMRLSRESARPIWPRARDPLERFPGLMNERIKP